MDKAEAIQPPERKNRARDFVREVPSEGPLTKREVEQRGVDADIKPRTLERAAEQLGVVYRRNGFGGENTWSLKQ